MTRFLFFAIIVIALFSTQAWALAPPGEIEKWNLDADLIVYGRVEKAMLDTREPLFLLRIIHVIKGVDKIKINDLLTIYCDPVPEKKSLPGLARHTQGIIDVHVEPGDQVITYLKQDDRGRYKPVLKGLSVIVPVPPEK